MKKLTLPIIFALLGVTLVLWLPSQVVFADAPNKGGQGAELPRPLLDITDTYTFYIGEPLELYFEEDVQTLQMGGFHYYNVTGTVEYGAYFVGEIIQLNTPDVWYDGDTYVRPRAADTTPSMFVDESTSGFDSIYMRLIDYFWVPGVISQTWAETIHASLSPSITLRAPNCNPYGCDGIPISDTINYKFQRRNNPFSGYWPYSHVTVWPVLYGVEPPAACAAYSAGDDCRTGTIYGTDQDGVAISVMPGEYYYLSITDGPWNNGSLDRYDAALSWDRVTWTPLSSFDGCVDTPGQLRSSIYIEAQDTVLYLRVNDVGGAFADNSGSLGYSICDAEYDPDGDDEDENTCEDYYTIGEWLVDGRSVSAGDELGDLMPPSPLTLEDGKYYMLQTVPEPWADNLSPVDLSGEAEMALEYSGADDSWYDLPDYPKTVCVGETLTGYQRIYFEADDTTYGIRANTEDSNWLNNDYDLHYDLYAVEYDPPQDSCESAFNIIAEQESYTIQADRESGYVLGQAACLQKYTTYAIETYNGPWYECSAAGCAANYNVEISNDYGESWYPISDYPWSLCTADKGQYTRLYFETSSDDECKYKVRVEDGDDPNEFTDNRMSIDYVLYLVQSYQQPPSTGDCYENYEISSPYTITVDATLEQGDPFPGGGQTMVAAEWYAVQAAPPAWDDGTIGDNKTGGITSDGRLPDSMRDWDAIEYWDGAACVEDLGDGYYRVYYRALDAVDYRYRAQDETDSDWSNNSGNATYVFWQAEYTSDAPPPCGNPSNLDQVADDGEIPANLEHGISLDSYIQAGNWYRLETREGPWTGGTPDPSYWIDISEDGGNTWTLLGGFGNASCRTIISAEGHERVYFQAESGKSYRLRVHDTADNFYDNEGTMGYILYKTSDDGIPDPEDPPGVQPPPSQYTGCNAICTPPAAPSPATWGGWTELGNYIIEMTRYLAAWISNIGGYLGYWTCNFGVFISWCPYHTDVVLALPDIYENKEPYGTVQEFIDTYNAARAEIDSYEWVDSSSSSASLFVSDSAPAADSAPEIAAPENFFLAPAEAGDTSGDSTITYLPWDTDSIWSGDEFSWPETETLNTVCENDLAESLGPLLSPGVCFGFSALEWAGINSWFQWLVNISMLGMLFAYFKTRWVDNDGGEV